MPCRYTNINIKLFFEIILNAMARFEQNVNYLTVTRIAK